MTCQSDPHCKHELGRRAFVASQQLVVVSREQIVSAMGMPSNGKFVNAHRAVVMLVADQSSVEMAPLLEQYRERLEHDSLKLSAAAQVFVAQAGACTAILPHIISSARFVTSTANHVHVLESWKCIEQHGDQVHAICLGVQQSSRVQAAVAVCHRGRATCAGLSLSAKNLR